ncbi:MAG: proton-conducting transporter membrane subunit, partial [Planctomycetota bacterium JB042]
LFRSALAYSSVAQIGYILVGVTMLTVDGMTGALVHVFNHALMKGGLFMVLGCVVARVGGSRLGDLRGIGRRMPLTAIAFVIGGLGMIGVPTTVGFVSKWYLVLGALEAGRWPVAALMLVSSLLAVVYIWRVVEVMYFQEPEDAPDIDESKTDEAPLGMLLPTLVMIGATIWFGLDTDLTVDVARRTAAMLLGDGS